MARTGRFGRLPRAVPSLQNTLLAIAREQQQTEDQNLMSAWAKGGFFKGQKATDEFMLDYWRKRVDNVSKDDPLYDTYHNAVLQYEYTIAESKKTAAYAQIASPSGAQDRDMYQFYMRWAKKIPKDSEFYRVLLRDAGQYLRSAKAKSDAAARQTEADKYSIRMGNIERHNERAGQLVLSWITKLSQEGAGGRNAFLGEQPLGAARDILGRTNISEMTLPDTETLIGLLGLVSPINDPKTGKPGTLSAGNPQVLFTDENGQPVTGQTILDSLRGVDPTFDGHFDLAYVHKAMQQQAEGIAQRMELAKRTGHISDYSDLAVLQAKNNEYMRQIDALPVAKAYSDLATQKAAVMADNSLMPGAKARALEAINAKIGDLANDPRIAEDGHMQSQLRGEAEGVAGTITLQQDLQGQTNNEDNPAQDVVGNEAATIETLRLQAEQGAQPGWTMTKGEYDDNGNFTPGPNGTVYGAASIVEVNNLSNNGAGKPVTMMIDDGTGALSPATIVPLPVTVSGGAGTDVQGSKVIGSYIEVNGQRLFSQTPGGGPPWSADAFWSNAVKGSVQANGDFNLDLSDYVKTLDPNALPDGFKLNTSRTTGEQTLVLTDPRAAVYGTAPERPAAGFDPNSDSWSPTLALLTRAPDGVATLLKMKDDPNFKLLLDHDAHIAAGDSVDLNSPTGWSGGNADIYNRATAMASIVIGAVTSHQDANAAITDANNFHDAWDKAAALDSPSQATYLGRRGGYGQQGATAQYGLPSDMLRKDDTGRFHVLTTYTAPGSNMIRTGRGGGFGPGAQATLPKQATGQEYTGTQFGMNLKLPSVPNVGGTPGTPSVTLTGAGPKAPTPKAPKPKNYSGSPDERGQLEY